MVSVFSFSQGFNRIVPLESTCDDLKRILGIAECSFPQDVLWLQDYRISVKFTSGSSEKNGKLCYRVPAGRVILIAVSYNVPILIKDFPYNLTFREKLYDIDTLVYENVDSGVSVTANNGYVATATFVPTPAQHKKFAYPCGKAKAGYKKKEQVVRR
jgi:hypothetical protein